MALTNTFDTNTPLGTAAPSVIDNRIREVKAAVQERMNDYNGSANEGDHYWPLTGTEVSDTDSGEHRKVTLRVGSAPTERADTITLYAKDVSSVAELFAIDEDGNEVQLTQGGVSSIGHSVTAKTSDYTVTAAELKNNTTFTNTGASGAVAFTLPTAVAGYKVRFIVTVAQELRITPDSGNAFRMLGNTSTADKYIYCSTVGASIALCFDGTDWVITEIVGGWDEEA